MKNALTAIDVRGARLPWVVTLICIIGALALLFMPEVEAFKRLHSHYLPIHMFLESLSIFVSLGVFILGWATYEKASNTSILFLSLTSLSVAILDFGHTLSFTGMPDFITPSGPNKAIYFWLASRFTDTAAMLFIAFFYSREFRFKRFAPILMGLASVWTALWYLIILYHQDKLSIMFIPGEGLTLEKVILEWLAIIIAFIASVIFFIRARANNDVVLDWLSGASLISAMVGIFFTQYRAFDDLFNLAGHVYKAISFAMIFFIVFDECVARPYEDMKKLARETAEANEAKIRFLANVSHEFRTPLGVISGFSDLLLGSKQLGDEERQWSGTIYKSAAQLRILIDDLLDLAKVETGRISTNWSRFQVSEVVDDVASGLQLLAQQKNLPLVVTFDAKAPHTINSDPQRLRQVLVNLIGNAIKFTDKGSVTVLVEASASGGLKISIEDTGIGIHAHAVDRLFKPFSQVDDTLRRRTGGTGLGLALSKKLAHVLGGELWLERTSPDEGSLFIFTVADQRSGPVSTAAKNEVSAIIKAPDLKNISILAADDSPENLNLLRLYLKDTGALVKTVVNGQQALNLCRAEAFHIVLMDVQMPEMDGYEATGRIRKDGWKAPIIAVTAHAQLGERERALKEGFDDYLVKPFTKEQLWQMILNYLKK